MSLSKKKFKNHFGPINALTTIGNAIIVHPIAYFQVLTELGYEPIPPYRTKTLFSTTTRLTLPGVFGYMSHMRTTYGWIGLYRGLSCHMMSRLINGFVRVNISSNKLLDFGCNYRNDNNRYKKLLIILSVETLKGFVALCVSYPFRVMTVRMCAQIVDNQNNYDSIVSVVTDIYQTGGVSGFYAGFVPHFLGKCLQFYCVSVIMFMVNSFIDHWFGQTIRVKKAIVFILNMKLESIFHSFHLVSTVMCCNGLSGRSRLYGNWIECWRHLSNERQLKRGSQLVWRYVNEPNVKNDSAFRGLVDNALFIFKLFNFL